MKVLLLAGGLGTRLAEETELRPKPMVAVAGMPILWHIMKIYSAQGFHDFVVLCGYKGYMIKEFFANYLLHASDVTIDFRTGQTEVHSRPPDPWRVTLLDTGADTQTGGRVLRAREHVEEETFMLTYGDGVADVDLKALLAFHHAHGKAATMTVVQPDGRFGAVSSTEEGRIQRFMEKPAGDGAWINGGFFVCNRSVFDYVEDGDATVFEQGPLERLAADGELYGYRHDGFWKCMDTLRDKTQLNRLWETGQAKWKVWS